MAASKKESKSVSDKAAEYLKILLDNTIKGFVLLDKNYKILMYNTVADKGMKFFYNKPMQVGASYWDYVDKKDNTSFIRHFEKALAGKKITTEKSLKNPKGESIWIEAGFVPVFDTKNKVNSVLYSYLNITEKKETEQALSESEANLRAVFNSSRDGYFLISPNFNLLAINPAARLTFIQLYNTKINIGDNLLNYIDSDAKLSFIRNMKIALKGGYVVSGGQKLLSEKPYYYELKYNGVKNETGEIYAVTIVTSDVTEKKLAEKALSASETNLRSIFNNTSHTFYLIDKDFKVVAFNQSASRMIRMQFNRELKKRR